MIESAITSAITAAVESGLDKPVEGPSPSALRDENGIPYTDEFGNYITTL